MQASPRGTAAVAPDAHQYANAQWACEATNRFPAPPTRGRPNRFWRFMNRMGRKGAKPRPDALAPRIAGRRRGRGFVGAIARCWAFPPRNPGASPDRAAPPRLPRHVCRRPREPLAHQGRWMAAARGCETARCLQPPKRSDALGPPKPREGAVDVTGGGLGGRKRRQGVGYTRSQESLTPKAATIRQGIPTTTPARTILDLRRVADRRILEDAVGQAEIRRLPIGRLPGYSTSRQGPGWSVDSCDSASDTRSRNRR